MFKKKILGGCNNPPLEDEGLEQKQIRRQVASTQIHFDSLPYYFLPKDRGIFFSLKGPARMILSKLQQLDGRIKRPLVEW